MSDKKWERIARIYDPLKAGSIDGTDTVPHDHGVVRAMQAEYKPNQLVTGDPKATIFVGRLNHQTTESTLQEIFSRYGDIKKLRLIRDIVTGFSRGYAFIEYFDKHDAVRAEQKLNKTVIDNSEILVEEECERILPGWIPRRLGGGFGGKKESGQLRFGGKDRPFRKPIMLFDKQNKKDDYGSRSSRRDHYDSRDYYDSKNYHDSGDYYDSRDRYDKYRSHKRSYDHS